MQAVIANSLVNSLKPAEKPYEVRDTQLKGLLLRVQPTGVMTFYLEYARGKRLRLGRAGALTPAQARDQAKAMLAEAYQGKDPAAARRQAHAHSFRSFVDEVYSPWAEGNIRTAKATARRLKSNFPDFQEKKLTDITPWLVEKWRLARLKSGVKVSTVNRDLDDLKSSLSKAAQWGLVENNPIGSVKRSRVDTSPRERFLKPDEGTRLLLALDAREERIRRERETANEWRRDRGYALLPNLRDTEFADRLKPMVLLSLHTGLRQGEMFSLTWPDVDLEEDDIMLKQFLSGSGRRKILSWASMAGFILFTSGLVYSTSGEVRRLTRTLPPRPTEVPPGTAHRRCVRRQQSDPDAASEPSVIGEHQAVTQLLEHLEWSNPLGLDPWRGRVRRCVPGRVRDDIGFHHDPRATPQTVHPCEAVPAPRCDEQE